MKQNICLITFPTGKSGTVPLANFVEILYPLSNTFTLITGNEGYAFFKNDPRISTYGVTHQSGRSTITRILKYIYTQIKISSLIYKSRKNTDIYILSIGGESLILPIISIKLINKTSILALAGFTIKFSKSRALKVLKLISDINLRLVDKIVLYSSSLIKEWELEKYESKILIAPRHFLNFNTFSLNKSYSDRKNLVGYVGRFSPEKGVMNFIEAIPLILNERSDIDFLLIGDGPLRSKTEEYILEKNISEKVHLTGWISHDNLTPYLNDLKLVLLPSYTEGLPNLMLEAMACGVPVLATPVGSITNIITDKKNGFIMENNSSECIAKSVIESISNSNLEKISSNAVDYVNREFNYNVALSKYKSVLEGI